MSKQGNKKEVLITQHLHTMPCITRPCHISPCHAAPLLAMSRLSAPRLTSPNHNHKLRPALDRILHMRVSRFVTRYTQRFQVRRVVRAIPRKLQHMMNVAIEQLNRRATVAALPAIAGIDILPQRSPQLNGHPSVPGKVQPRQFVKREGFLALDVPCHTGPRISLHHRAYASIARPNRAIAAKLKPCHTVPHRAAPRQIRPENTPPYLDSPNQAAPTKTKALPYLTVPNQTRPSRGCTHITSHHHNHKLLLGNLKPRDREATEARAEVANAHSLTRERQGVLYHVGGQLVINNGDLKIQRPTRFECRADANHTGALDNDRAAIEVQGLVSVGVKHIGHRHTVGDFVRADEQRSLEQLLVGRAALAGDLEVRRRLDHRAFDVYRRLVDFARLGRIQIFAPLLGVVLCTRLLLAALAQVLKLWHGVAMLHQGSRADDPTVDGVHTLPPTKEAPRGCTCVLAEGTQVALRGWYESAVSASHHGNKKNACALKLGSLSTWNYSIGVLKCKVMEGGL